MSCTGCKKTKYQKYKDIDRKAKTATFSIIIIILLSLYGIWSLISKLW